MWDLYALFNGTYVADSILKVSFDIKCGGAAVGANGRTLWESGPVLLVHKYYCSKPTPW